MIRNAASGENRRVYASKRRTERKERGYGMWDYVGSKLRPGRRHALMPMTQIPRVRESQTDGLVNHAHIWICLVRGLTTISRQQQDSAIPKKDCRRGPRGFPGDHPSVSALRLGYAIWLRMLAQKRDVQHIQTHRPHACCPWACGITPSISPRGPPAAVGVPASLPLVC